MCLGFLQPWEDRKRPQMASRYTVYNKMSGFLLQVLNIPGSSGHPERFDARKIFAAVICIVPELHHWPVHSHTPRGAGSVRLAIVAGKTFTCCANSNLDCCTKPTDADGEHLADHPGSKVESIWNDGITVLRSMFWLFFCRES